MNNNESNIEMIIESYQRDSEKVGTTLKVLPGYQLKCNESD